MQLCEPGAEIGASLLRQGTENAEVSEALITVVMACHPFAVAGLPEHAFQEIGGRRRGALDMPILEECDQRSGACSRSRSVALGRQDQLFCGHWVNPQVFFEARQPARWRVHDTSERICIVQVVRQSEVRHCVPNLPACEQVAIARYSVGQAVLPKRHR